MTEQDPDGPSRSAPLLAGVGLVVASLVAAATTATGVTVPVDGFDVVSLVAGALALGFVVWGLRSATKGAYRQGVGALSGGAGLVLVFLAPQARSAPLFVGTGALIVALAGLFLIAEGFGYVLVEVDDVEDGKPPSNGEVESATGDGN